MNSKGPAFDSRGLTGLRCRYNAKPVSKAKRTLLFSFCLWQFCRSGVRGRSAPAGAVANRPCAGGMFSRLPSTIFPASFQWAYGFGAGEMLRPLHFSRLYLR